MVEPADPKQILAAMAKVYGSCRTYRDTGTHVANHVYTDRPARADAKRFATCFVRPDRFRFEYRYRFSECSPEESHGIWAHGTDVLSWIEGPVSERESHSSLPEILHAWSGVSSCLSWIVPFLFLPGWGNGKPWKLLSAIRLTDADIDGVDCYRVQGNWPTTPGHEELCRELARTNLNEEWHTEEGPVTLWVERDRFLLRRFEQSCQFNNFRAYTVANYSPEIDAAITDEELAYPREESS